MRAQAAKLSEKVEERKSFKSQHWGGRKRKVICGPPRWGGRNTALEKDLYYPSIANYLPPPQKKRCLGECLKRNERFRGWSYRLPWTQGCVWGLWGRFTLRAEGLVRWIQASEGGPDQVCIPVKSDRQVKFTVPTVCVWHKWTETWGKHLWSEKWICRHKWDVNRWADTGEICSSLSLKASMSTISHYI